jgi:hypothetical protein
LDGQKISTALQAALKKDDSLLNLGLAFHLASRFKAPELRTPFLDRIGDTLVQADEVNSKFLQVSTIIKHDLKLFKRCYCQIIEMHFICQNYMSQKYCLWPILL